MKKKVWLYFNNFYKKRLYFPKLIFITFARAQAPLILGTGTWGRVKYYHLDLGIGVTK